VDGGDINHHRRLHRKRKGNVGEKSKKGRTHGGEDRARENWRMRAPSHGRVGKSDNLLDPAIIKLSARRGNEVRKGCQISQMAEKGLY